MTTLLDMTVCVCLAAHLWSMNVSSVAPLFGVWLQSRQPTEVTLDVARRTVSFGLAMLFVGVGLGLVIAGLMWWSGKRGLFEVLPLFHHKLFWGAWELVFYTVCVGALLLMMRRSSSSPRWIHWALAILASTNLLYHFPPLFAVMSRAAEEPSSVTSAVGPREFRTLMMTGHVASLSVHFGLASFAVTAVEVAQRLLHAAADNASDVSRLARRAGAVALTATVLQIPVGGWLLMRIDAIDQQQILGQNGLATALFGASVLGSFWLMHLLASMTFGEGQPSHTRMARRVMALIILLMTAVLQQI